MGLGSRIRKAGSALVNKALDADQAYAQRVQRDIDPAKQPIAEMTRGVPLRDLFKGGQADTMAEKAALLGLTTAVGAANVASRYALPAGGVTLAGKALIDLTASFGTAADQPEQSTLPLN